MATTTFRFASVSDSNPNGSRSAQVASTVAAHVRKSFAEVVAAGLTQILVDVVRRNVASLPAAIYVLE